MKMKSERHASPPPARRELLANPEARRAAPGSARIPSRRGAALARATSRRRDATTLRYDTYTCTRARRRAGADVVRGASIDQTPSAQVVSLHVVIIHLRLNVNPMNN